MKIIVTGSLGHISKPLAIALVQQGHLVTVVSSNPHRQKDIEALGASATFGSVEDPDFLSGIFTGADAVYCMTPPNFAEPDQIGYYERLGDIYAKAIQRSGIKRVLYLSSYGAHLESGAGFITGSHKAEKLLDRISGISLTHIRPTYFYYNLFGFIKMIKTAGFIGAVYGGEDKLAMVSPKDIASAIAEELTSVDSPEKVRYVTSDDRTCNDVAHVLGKAIGIPGLQWHILPREQVIESLLNTGVPENAALNLVELGLATHSGILREDYEHNMPPFGKVTLEDFAREFAFSYNS